jgi:hypothetical protein
VTFSKVRIGASVLSPASAGLSSAWTVADAVPALRASLPLASMMIVWLA